MRLSLLCATLALSLSAQTVERPVRSVTDPGVVTTRQAVTPAGVSSIFQGRVYGLAWAGTADELWVFHASEVYRMNWRQNRVLSRITHRGTPGNQSITADPAGNAVVIGQGVPGENGARSRVSIVTADGLRPVAANLGRFLPGAIAVSEKRRAAIPLVWENKLAVVDLESGEVVHQIPVGIAPFAAAIQRDGAVAWVSNLGGRPPKPGEPFASPNQKPSENVTVDARGIASTGTVSRVDLTAGQVTHTLPVGLHPTALALDEARKRLYVANGNSESVSVIDTAASRVLRTIDLQPFADKVRGIAPTAIQVSPDGGTLYVACGGINAVAIVDLTKGTLKGLIPTAWYPNGLALDPTGRHLAVASLLGPGSGWRESPSKRFVHANRGSVSVIDIPDAAQLTAYTTAVGENNRLRLAGSAPVAPARPSTTPVAVPSRSGDASLIEHVVFIIKENRTYDQVLGDMEKGNGDPSLVMFGPDVTPNQHRLADQFVLLDNFYATGGNSADGHQWITQANETEYCLWPGYQGRSYPFDGNDPMASSSGGFIWNYALARGRTVRVNGEYSGTTRSQKPRAELLRMWNEGASFDAMWTTRAPIADLNKILAPNFPAYTTTIPDVARAKIFISELKRFESEGKMPNLTLLQLPSNHTQGTTPGASTPKAMVADNDLAVGQVVEALSHSKFWPKMAIFVVEDDAQNGVDHVDGHRTVGLVISPYTRRGHVDSTFYSHQSMLKTIELMLGLPTMSLFDLIANDMRASFTNQADATPYDSVKPAQDLFEVNPAIRALSGRARDGAKASARMDWAEPDDIPTERLNRILWGSIKGWDKPYPAPKNSMFSPLSLERE